jgi:HK97 family phage major capsid protein
VWTITGAGSVNPIRALATIKKATSNNYHGITAAQITASWDSEGSAVSDDSPTLSGPTLTLYTVRAWVQASFEAFEDIVDLAGEVSKLFADAKNNLENTTFLTGTGSSQPKGIVTALGAVTASRVSPATGGAFAIADLYSVQNALPARHSPGASWLASLTTINKARRFGEGTTGSNSAFWGDLGAGTPPELLGRPVYEASPMSTSYTTGQDIMAYGDWSKYWIADHVRGTMIEFVPQCSTSVRAGRTVSGATCCRGGPGPTWSTRTPGACCACSQGLRSVADVQRVFCRRRPKLTFGGAK